MPALYTLDRLRPEYVPLFDRMEISNSKRAAAKSQALKIIANKDRYKAVQAKTDIPWFVIGCIHFRESSGDFNTYLGNGDPLHAKSVNVPKGRGPFASWEDGAYDALVTIENLNDIDYSGPEACAYATEKINGWAYRSPSRNIPSPYLWGGTNIQKPGKFVRDHVYDSGVMDTQLGTMAVLRMLMDLDSDVVFAGVPATVPAPVPSPPLAPTDPPKSPRADDTETNVKPLSQSMTIRGLILKMTGLVTGGAAIFLDFLKTPFGFATFCVAIGAIGLGFVMVLKGRIDVQNMLKHLSIDDTKPA